MKKVLSVLAAVIMLAAFSARAEAVVLNFDDLEAPGTVLAYLPDYISDGFILTSSVTASNAFSYAQQSNGWYYGSANLFNSYSGKVTTLSAVSGDLFTIHSLDIHQLYIDMSIYTLTFYAYAADDSLLGSQSIDVTYAGPWSTINFGSDFQNIAYMKCSAQQYPYFAFDNIVLSGGSAVVPEPASMGLLLSGLLGVIGLRRK